MSAARAARNGGPSPAIGAGGAHPNSCLALPPGSRIGREVQSRARQLTSSATGRTHGCRRFPRRGDKPRRRNACVSRRVRCPSSLRPRSSPPERRQEDPTRSLAIAPFLTLRAGLRRRVPASCAPRKESRVDWGSVFDISFDASFLTAVLSIILIDLVLAGDNAVVIAMAVRNLPPHQRRRGILLGAGAAVVAAHHRHVLRRAAPEYQPGQARRRRGHPLDWRQAVRGWHARRRSEEGGQDPVAGGQADRRSPTSRCRSTTCWPSAARRTATCSCSCSGSP